MQTRGPSAFCEGLLDLAKSIVPLLPLAGAGAEMAADPHKEVREEPMTASKVALRGEAEHSVKADSPHAIARALESLLPVALPNANSPVSGLSKMLGGNT